MERIGRGAARAAWVASLTLGLISCSSSNGSGLGTPDAGTSTGEEPGAVDAETSGDDTSTEPTASPDAPTTGVTVDAAPGTDSRVPAPPGKTDTAAPTPGQPSPGQPPGPALACTNLPRARQPFGLSDLFPHLPPFSEPTAAGQAPGTPEAFYVFEQAGLVKRFANRADVTAATVALDLSGKVDSEGDAGILGFAFHPKFAQNGELYLSYAQKGSPLKSHLSRFTSKDGGMTFDPTSEVVLIEIPQPDPEKIHLNCDIHFGADGFLWAGFGDGGFDEDDRGEAQNVGSINGKILRIDVDKRGGALPYGIPADNPFVGRAGARGEVWAIGFRNPWRWRFDPADPMVLWAGELGSDRREEIDRVVKGGNYGWNNLEGTICLQSPCSAASGTPPWVEYHHNEGKSVTAGPVYRGQELPALRDRLIYSDFVSGHVWALPSDRSPKPELILDTELAVVSFAETLDGELVLLDHEGGRLHKIVATPPGAGLPEHLSETGCFTAGATPVAAMVPYDVNAPLWSDGASKRRWMAVPAGQKIAVGADGDFQFPVGTTLVKEFSVGGTRVETRIFARHADGGWAGYSYAWNAEQTDATLMGLSSTPVAKQVGAANWTYPTRWHCMACHTKEAGFSLGPEVAQLNRTFKYADGERNQLDNLDRLGLLATKLGASAGLPALAAPDGTAPIGDRARAYLHANCSGCHRPNDVDPEGMDLRYTKTLAGTKVCNTAVYGGFDGATKRVTPGKPAASVIPLFMRSMDEIRMPLVGTTVVDDKGVALIEAWIAGLTSCN